MNSDEHIPFRVDIRRMLDLLARQIYQSPLALLRENCQNAFDAILQRIALDKNFNPEILITIEPGRIVVRDNGIGMTRGELEKNFWTAGSSGKNTPEARAAGVVGTFGIGAMANFGIADSLEVITESTSGGERLISSVKRENLSASESCIQISHQAAEGSPGTTVLASIPTTTPVDVRQAENYITDFVRFLEIPVFINDRLISKGKFEEALPRPPAAELIKLQNVALSPQLGADVTMELQKQGEVWLHLENIHWSNALLSGEILLKQNASQLKTYRTRFSLAGTAVASSYNFGGIVNLSNLQPTAGREALTTESMQFLQTLIAAVDGFVSLKISTLSSADTNTGFQTWVTQHGRYDLCGKMTINMLPSDEAVTLADLRTRSEKQAINYYEGSDKTIRDNYATDEKPLVIPSQNNPRRQCQSNFVRQFTKLVHVSDSPQVLHTRNKDELTFAEGAFAFRISNILENDYFVLSEVQFGTMTHGLPFLVDTTGALKITFDSSSGQIGTILKLYDSEFSIFTGMVKDFVRSVIFPKIANLVPSSTRQGAEAFLNSIRRPREYIEYEMAEADALRSILGDYLEGKISFREAAEASARRSQVNYQIVDAATTQAAVAVIPDVVDNARRILADAGGDDFTALPAITRLELEANAKLLTIADAEQALKTYRCFIAIADRVRREHAEFFLQPHKTEIVWGGQKALYIFQHISGTFALYYELQSNEMLSESSGGRTFPTCTIALKNQVYIPIPEELRAKFIPAENVRKRFAVRSDLLFPES